MDDAERWSRIEQLFDDAIDLDAEERGAFLDRACTDPALCAEVEKLLQAAQASSDFLESPADTAARLAPGSVVGDWRVGALLGRGGMGEVYAAERVHRDFSQRAALKLLHRFDSPEARQRFAEERRILGRLEHPGIAHLLDGGEHAGVPYAVMEFVEGTPLTTHARPLPLRSRIELFLQVCAAVSHAHRHLVVHRDLKPGNILVTADGRVKLLDFGIAKPLDAATTGDVTQVIRASPDYCAPEQLRGEPVSAATDVYALGVILHELLTGRRLWDMRGAALVQTIERLTEGEPPLPSSRTDATLARRLRGDLDSIVLKALRARPEQRYASVEALAADLRAWLDNRPVAARDGTLPYLLGRTIRRRRWWFAAGAAVFAALLVGLAGVLWQAREARIERDLARREAERADAVRQYLMLMFRSAGDQPDGTSITAKSVLDQAAARVHDEFAGDPGAYADIVIALAELYFSLDDYTGARPLLERLLREGSAVPAEQRAMAQHDLAQIEFRNDQQSEAAEMLAAAQSFWNARPQAYREELAMSRLLQSQLERIDGNPEQALRTLEQTLPERIALSGENHRETGKLVNNLGIAYYQVGRFDDAIVRFEQASRIWAALGLTRSADALNTLNNWAAAEMRSQRPQAAVPLFERALALRRELYPPSAALAALINNLGKTLTQLGRADEGLPLLREAAALGAEYAGAASVLTVSARLGVADALSASGQTDAAATELDALSPLLLSTYGETHVLTAMLDLSRARLAKARGDAGEALRHVDRAESRLRELGAGGAPYLPQVEVLRQQWTGTPS
ncbi:MAG: protein kinase domain-containing protein [Sinimarinibacterium flocculans]|uniref:protein kinase domain-containing protein n=1 Tax=Sinimarinibacterium flocculans TaxID=985250 RepID=UPI003C3F3ED8